MSKPKILTIIPARGGSKRLPRKNVLLLGEKPLIQWTIEAAQSSGVCQDILVSTDDREIAKVASEAGVMVPWLRPAELASDVSSTSEVIAHALSWYEKNHFDVDAVLLLQPTSPFRSPKSIRYALEAYYNQNRLICCPLVSVMPTREHPGWTFIIKDGIPYPNMGWQTLAMRSQDLPPVYTLNGAIYVIPSEDVRGGKQIVRPGFIPFIMNDEKENLDIDTAEDWLIALMYAQENSKI